MLEGKWCYSSVPRLMIGWISAVTPSPTTTSSFPASVLIGRVSFAASEWLIATAVKSPVTSTTPALAASATLSGALVPLIVIESAAPSPAVPPIARGQIDVGLRHVGAAQVVDGRRVRAAERPEVDLLRVVHVHRDVPEVAEEAEPRAVGGEVEHLRTSRAVEDHRVDPRLTLDDVAAVAGIPAERVVVGTEEPDVVALVAVDRVVAVAAEEHLGSVAAVQRVVSGAAVHPDLDQGREPDAAVDRVVAAEPVDVQEVVRRLRALDLHGRGQTGHVDRTGVRGDRIESLPPVPLIVVVSTAAVTAARSRIDVPDVGRGQVVHDRVVDAAESAEIDPLDVVDVHRDVRDVAEEPQAVAVGGEVEVLRDCRRR